MTEPDPYKTLQVDPEAEDEVIVAAYRRLAMKYHPDTASGPEAATRMAAITAAWERVGDPAKRAAYDRERQLAEAMARARPTPAPAPAPAPNAAASSPPRPPETVSRDWTSGRSSVGGGYDASMHSADGTGAAGPPPGNASGSVLNFGRYAGWSLGEIARTDLGYLEWLDRMPIGRSYRDEIDVILRRTGLRRSAEVEANDRRGLFRRR
jgi:curved DNA-binding protein CbpA